MSIGLLLMLNTATCAVPELVPGAKPSALSFGEEHYEWAPTGAIVGISVHRAGTANALIAEIVGRLDSENVSARIQRSKVALSISVEGRLTEEIGKTLSVSLSSVTV